MSPFRTPPKKADKFREMACELRDALQGTGIDSATAVKSLELLGVEHRVENLQVAERALIWDLRFLDVARLFSTWSKDPSTKVGCVIVGPDREIRATGFNGFARGVEDSLERLENRELKYALICHAEENTILHAARIGVSLKGCTAYTTFPPCTRCARNFIQAGIVEVVFPECDIPDRWVADVDMAGEMLKEAGVRTRAVS